MRKFLFVIFFLVVVFSYSKISFIYSNKNFFYVPSFQKDIIFDTLPTKTKIDTIPNNFLDSLSNKNKIDTIPNNFLDSLSNKNKIDTIPNNFLDSLSNKNKIDTIPNNFLDSLSNKNKIDTLPKFPFLLDTIPASKLDTVMVFGAMLVIPSAIIPKKRTGKIYSEEEKIAIRKAIEDSIREANKIVIEDYIQIDNDGNTKFLDTTISIEKEYKFNYLRKDYFELLPFSNVGQTFNKLGYNFFAVDPLPQIGVKAKHFNFLKLDDIYYSKNPTPLLEFFYRSVFRQGQLASVSGSINPNEQFNFYISFKSLRSIGRYVGAISDSENFIFSSNYTTKKGYFVFKTQYTSQNIDNEENGGLTNTAINSFLIKDREFRNRSRLQTVFENANNILKGESFFYDISLNFFRNKKDEKNKNNFHLNIGYKYFFETKSFEYNQTNSSIIFGLVFNNLINQINDKASFQKDNNAFYAKINHKWVGHIKIERSTINLNYFFNSIYYGEELFLPNRIENNLISNRLIWEREFKPIGKISVDLQNFLEQEKEFAYHYKTNIDIYLSPELTLTPSFGLLSKKPDFNFQLYQSDYKDFNWNNLSFENQEVTNVALSLKHKKWGVLTATGQQIKNFTYFENTKIKNNAISEAISDTLNILNIIPQQLKGPLNYLKVRYRGTIEYKKFSLTNTLQYQRVFNNDTIINIPDIVMRSTLAFTTPAFKKAILFQMGFNFNYFNSYYADDYVPLLGEFATQNKEILDGFPFVDFFINGKVKQTRLFLRLEHLNTTIENRNYFSARGHPYRDFNVRVGFIWNFFQ